MTQARAKSAKAKPAMAKAKSAKAKSAATKPTQVKRVGVVTRAASRDAIRTAAELADWLRRRDVEVALDEPSLRALALRDVTPFDTGVAYDFVVVLGGDGTLLSVARSVASPILGVNLGRLGFLTELSRSELYPSLVKILAGDFRVEERSLFDVALRRAGGATAGFRAFNDAVIGKNALAKIIELEIKIGGALVGRYRCDGVIVSTPNGATAYNLSAGGPILFPALPVAVLTPLCPHTLSLRPIVVPDAEPIEITLQTPREEVFLTVDGQEGSSMGFRDTVSVKRCPSSAQLIRVSDRSFYDSLREKLKWGG